MKLDWIGIYTPLSWVLTESEVMGIFLLSQKLFMFILGKVQLIKG